MPSENRKRRKSKFSLRKLIYNDKYLIVLSVIAAVVIWIATSINLSPETTKSVTVPVTVDFPALLRSSSVFSILIQPILPWM